MKLDALDAGFVLVVTGAAMLSPWLALAVGGLMILALVAIDYRTSGADAPPEGTPE